MPTTAPGAAQNADASGSDDMIISATALRARCVNGAAIRASLRCAPQLSEAIEIIAQRCLIYEFIMS